MLGEPLAAEDVKSCCASLYQHPAVSWLLGGDLHPGGEATTRRALELAGVRPGDRLLDVASGTGASALLAARELDCQVVGVEYGEAAVRAAQAAAGAHGLEDRVSFLQADAEALPLPVGSFDAVLCECSLCTFPAKARAVREMKRVLRPGGRLALSDVVVDADRLPRALRGMLATVACIGTALAKEGYEQLLTDSGLSVSACESRDEDAAKMARRIEERLRGARLFGVDRLEGSPVGIEEAIELAGMARHAIAEGVLGYAIFGAVR
ncbi:MAG: methyltransferase domain-containing protein [Actinomycetota bacterium]|nr:methyltransferase domain-containing protein [Actinomycetota bacterium]